MDRAHVRKRMVERQFDEGFIGDRRGGNEAPSIQDPLAADGGRQQRVAVVGR